MRSVAATLLSLLALGCSSSAPPARPRPTWSAPIDADGVHLFVPVAWNMVRPWEPRPWRNGVRVDTGGWCSAEPWLGPLAGANPLPAGRFYRVVQPREHRADDRRDPCLDLTVTFEFPLRPRDDRWVARADPAWGFPFGIDRLTLTYRTPGEDRPLPYRDLLADLRPGNGTDVGDGWREVRRTFARQTILLRYDARDWRARGGAAPQRLAAAFDDTFWSHFMPLDRPRWSASFPTQRLPVRQWRQRYVVAEQLFAWLQTPPDQRNETHRFVWWTDLRDRPER